MLQFDTTLEVNTIFGTVSVTNRKAGDGIRNEYLHRFRSAYIHYTDRLLCIEVCVTITLIAGCSTSAVGLFNLGGQGVQFFAEYSRPFSINSAIVSFYICRLQQFSDFDRNRQIKARI